MSNRMVEVIVSCCKKAGVKNESTVIIVTGCGLTLLGAMTLVAVVSIVWILFR